jgi:hypothetical protein
VSLEQANTWLDMMIAQGYHSPIADLTPLLKLDVPHSGDVGE